MWTFKTEKENRSLFSVKLSEFMAEICKANLIPWGERNKGKCKLLVGFVLDFLKVLRFLFPVPVVAFRAREKNWARLVGKSTFVPKTHVSMALG